MLLTESLLTRPSPLTSNIEKSYATLWLVRVRSIMVKAHRSHSSFLVLHTRVGKQSKRFAHCSWYRTSVHQPKSPTTINISNNNFLYERSVAETTEIRSWRKPILIWWHFIVNYCIKSRRGLIVAENEKATKEPHLRQPVVPLCSRISRSG